MTDKPERTRMTVVFATLIHEPAERCGCCGQVTSASIGWEIVRVPAGTAVNRSGNYRPGEGGIAPCGATFGTAAGPNDGVTKCSCGEVHPVQATIAVPGMPPITVEQARLLRKALCKELGP